MKKLLPIILFYFTTISVFAQSTVGTIKLESGVQDGYTLFSVHKKSYLINNCGQVINEWTSDYVPGNAVYLLENGNLLRAGKLEETGDFNFGGRGGVVEIFDWDGNLIWQYIYFSDKHISHHDVYPMPNGNVLILAATKISAETAFELGRDPSKLTNESLYNEQIIEVTPVGFSDANVVWEWNIMDHLVQDFDNTKQNFGVVSESPNKLDINFLNGGQPFSNWLHINSIQYYEPLDQLVLSSRNLSEIWIIDHSTTTAEAATSSGGIYGKGGDFLYRWGNPQSYQRGLETDRKLYGQHYAHFIPEGLNDEGKIMIFNNGSDRTPSYSEVIVIDPPTSSPGFYLLESNLPFGPEQFDYQYTGSSVNGTDFYSAIVSSGQRLSNGNTLICEGRTGEVFEVNSANEIVWEYINPVNNNDGEIANQGEDVNFVNLIFRAIKYDTSYPAFTNRDLTPSNPIEGNFNLDACNTLSDSDILFSQLTIYPNPTANQLFIKSDIQIDRVEVLTLLGKKIKAKDLPNSIDVSSLNNGVYFLKIYSNNTFVYKKFIKS